MSERNESGVEDTIASHGKLSYVQIPAVDVDASAAFYTSVFGWTASGNAEHRSFTDASGQLIGAFTREVAAAREPGVLPYIYVNAPIEETVARIKAAGGTIARAPYDEGSLRVATFRDPAGNIIGIWSS